MFVMTPRRWVLSLAALLSLICLAVLSMGPRPAIIETATNAADLQMKIKEWGPEQCARLGFALGFDYLFMAAYVTAIGLGCSAVAEGASPWLRYLGLFLAYAQIGTGLIDATENAALIRLLTSDFSDLTMTIARLATQLKFLIPGAGLLYMLIVGPLHRRMKL